MPVNYIPQFIPTNAQALQGVLGEYQQAYDIESARQNQVMDMYSAIPTKSAYDTSTKNEVMQAFEGKLAELDKRYNYDRASSEYAKDLAREISGLRQNPLWSLIQQKDEINKIRTQLMAQRGNDYMENINPTEVQNAAELNNWKALDLNTLRQLAGTKAKEYAQQFNRTEISRPIDGVIQYMDIYGSKDVKEAINYLASDEGRIALEESIISAGFDPKDPGVYKIAKDAMLSNLVGESNISRDDDKVWMSLFEKGFTSSGPGLDKVGTESPIVNSYAASSARGKYKIDEDISAINEQIANSSDPDAIATLNEQRQIMQYEKDRVDGVIFKVESLPENQKIIGSLNVEINKELDKYKNSFIAGNKAPEINDILRDFFIRTNGWERTGLKSGESKVDAAQRVAEVLNGYVDPGRNIDRSIIVSIARDIVDIGTDWYKGRNTFVNNGYRAKVEREIDKELSTGEQPVFDKTSLPLSIKEADKSQIKSYIAANIGSAIPVESKYRKGGKNGVQWDESAFEKVKAAMKTGTSTDIHPLFDNKDNMLIQVTIPGDDKNKSQIVTLRFDPEQTSFDLHQSLYNATKDQRFLDQQYAAIKIDDNKSHTIGKDKYITQTLGRYIEPTSLSNLNGFSVKEIESPEKVKSYIVVTRNGREIIFDNKGGMIQALKELAESY